MGCLNFQSGKTIMLAGLLWAGASRLAGLLGWLRHWVGLAGALMSAELLACLDYPERQNHHVGWPALSWTFRLVGLLGWLGY